MSHDLWSCHSLSMLSVCLACFMYGNCYYLFSFFTNIVCWFPFLSTKHSNITMNVNKSSLSQSIPLAHPNRKQTTDVYVYKYSTIVQPRTGQETFIRVLLPTLTNITQNTNCILKYLNQIEIDCKIIVTYTQIQIVH